MPIGAISNGRNKQLELESWSLSPEVGDKWHQIDSEGQPLGKWTWNGISWVSEPLKSLFNFVDLNSSTNVIIPVAKDNNLFIEKIVIDYTVSGTNSNSKYWGFSLFRISNSYNWTWLGGEDTKSNWFAEKEILINQQDILVLTNTIYYLLQINRNRNAGNLSIAGQLNYKQIKDN